MATVTARAVHAIVSGRVQGVGYRWYVRERARELDLAGWVRNLRDGDVEIIARGDPESVERFLVLVKQGPPRSAVTSLRTSDPSAGVEFPLPFDIRH